MLDVWSLLSRKLRPRNFRPQTSKAQTSKHQTPWKTIEIVNAVLHECIYFFTIIIIVTNPKCQITQQSRIDNCRQVKSFLYFYSKQKRERQEQWQNYFTFSRVISGRKKDLNSHDSATIDVVRSYAFIGYRDPCEIDPSFLEGGGDNANDGSYFRLARGILLRLCDNVASSSASSYINIIWISFISRRSNRTQTHTQFVIEEEP